MGLLVLAVDDEKVFRDFIEQMQLWQKGEFLLAGTVRSAREALDFLLTDRVDVVLLDVSMPGTNGVALSAAIAQKYPEIEMIAVSGYDDYDYVREILKNGAHDYILKSRLSEELLEQTLRQLLERRRMSSPWEKKKGLRMQAGKWLFAKGEDPFTQDNSRKAAMVGRVSFSEKDTDGEKRTLAAGIARILEEETRDKQDVLAVYDALGRFVVFYRFYEEISEQVIYSKMERSRGNAIKNVERMFGLHLVLESCPCFYADHALRSYVLHKLDEGKEKEPARADRLAMTLEQQNELLSAVSKLDGERAEELVLAIYVNIPQEKEAMCMMVTRELLDVLERLSLEHEITLDFLPRDLRLFTYTQQKSRETLAGNIAGLYRNVLRELKEKKGTAHFSQAVFQAVSYMEEHYTETVTLGKTAEVLNVNSSYLSRIFHNETGMTFIEYLNKIRIDRAKELMERQIPLKEITSRCGFQSYAYFMKIFKERTGQTPREYLGTVISKK